MNLIAALDLRRQSLVAFVHDCPCCRRENRLTRLRLLKALLSHVVSSCGDAGPAIIWT